MHKYADSGAPFRGARCAGMALALAVGLAGTAHAQSTPKGGSRAKARAEQPEPANFAMVPAPMLAGPPAASEAVAERDYRVDAARHIYSAYPTRIYRGKLPPLLFSVMVVETEVDPAGQIVNVSVVRKPAVDEVAPWVVAMIRRSGPFPPPVKHAYGLKYTDVWLVDRSGNFQLDTLTEGQR